MNAAEITDKLGLHSLRQRAWVNTTASPSVTELKLMITSTFNLPARLPVMVCTRVSSGSATLSEKLVTLKWRYHVNVAPQFIRSFRIN
jgi:hypothetical protein